MTKIKQGHAEMAACAFSVLSALLLFANSARAAYFLTYPSHTDCIVRADTVLKVQTIAPLPATGECESFANTCDASSLECVVDANCLYTAVPSLMQEFVAIRRYDKNLCSGAPTRYEYLRLDTCVDKTKYTCDGDKITKTDFQQADCSDTGAPTEIAEDTCTGDSLYLCPIKDPNPTKKPVSRSDATTLAIAIIAGLMIVALAGLVIYFRRKHK